MTARLRLKCASLLLFFFVTSAEARWWKVQTSGTDANLRAVSAVYVPDAKAQNAPAPLVWASGSNGAILKSLDQGRTWMRLHVKDADALDFRGIVAFDANTAYVMSIGEGEKSRIYKTTDGGQTWSLQFTGSRKEIFLDSIACTSERECLALGDPIDGKFFLLKTTDGEHWIPLPTDKMPAALPGEAAFAASNSCITFTDGEQIFFGTGGAAARVFQSTDGGLTWTVARTLIVQGNASSGIFALRTDKQHHVLALGGDYKQPTDSDRVAATSPDNGKTWQLAAQQPGGFRSAVAQIDGGRWLAVGPTGEEVTEDYGAHWKHTDSLNLNAVAILDTQNGWAVGDHGRIARFVNHSQYHVRYRPANRQPPTPAIAD